MKTLTLIYSIVFIAMSPVFAQDIINETGRDGQFIVRTADMDTLMTIKDGNVGITGELKVAKMPEGTETDLNVVWDPQDKTLKFMPNIFSEASPLSKPLARIKGHSILSKEMLLDDGSVSILETAAVTWNQFDTDYGWIKLGPASNTAAHIYTDRKKFKFNKAIYSMTGKIGSLGNDLKLQIGGTTRLTINKTSGNVGIGTINPLSLLSVGGDGHSLAAIYGETSGSSGIGMYGKASGSDGLGVYGLASNSGGTNFGGYFEAYGSDGRGVYGYASDEGDVYNYGGYFRAEGSTGRGVYGYASNNGSVTNIGGSFKADGSTGRGVYGTVSGISGHAVYGYASNSGGTNYGGYFLAGGISGVGVRGSGSGTNGKGVVGSGKAYDFDAQGTGVDYGSTSSIRWKDDIVEIDQPLEKIAELRGVYFTWDEEHGGQHDVGMIAEEVGKVLPEIVVYEENGIDADGMDYSKLTPLLVEAVKALLVRVEELEQRID